MGQPEWLIILKIWKNTNISDVDRIASPFAKNLKQVVSWIWCEIELCNKIQFYKNFYGNMFALVIVLLHETLVMLKTDLFSMYTHPWKLIKMMENRYRK